jgi:transcriptional regulator with XRE-family HTH domain
MDTAHLLRDVRRRRGMSVRAAALRCDVPRATWGDWESGRAVPTTRRLDEVLDLLGFDLRLVPRGMEPDGADLVRRHLRRGLTWRAAAALGDQLASTWLACSESPRLLTGPAAAGIWVPHVVARGPLPLPPARDTTGWVPVHLVSGPHDPGAMCFVPTPAMLISEGKEDAWPQLLTAARLLAYEAPLDGVRRQLPPHRDPDERREARDLNEALTWAGRGRIPISPTDSRAWRLDAPATLDAALREAGLPVRNASRRGRRQRPAS